MDGLNYKIPTEVLMLLNSNLKKISATIYSFKKRSFNILEHLSSGDSYSYERYSYFIDIEKIANVDSFFYLKIMKKPVQDSYPPRSAKVFLFFDQEKGMLFCFSNSSNYDLKIVFHPFLKDFFYRELNRCYVNSSELKESLEKMSEYYGLDLYSKWWTAKKRFGSNIKFEKKMHDAVDCFEISKKDLAAINWMRVIARREDSSFEIDVSRNANIVCHNTSKLDEVVFLLKQYADYSLDRTDFLKNKDLYSQKRPVPIRLQYANKVFNDHKNRKILIDKLKDKDNISYSIIHGINPHVYILVTDRLDYSSFTLKTQGNDKILLIPHIYATNNSLNRFIHFLNENFEEYEVMDEIEI